LEREVWCCGPGPFMAAVRAMLAEVDFDMGRYHEESFSFESLAPDTAEAAEASAEAGSAGGEAKRFVVTLKSRGERFECAADESVLKAAQRAGIRWPFSCASGVCGTCRTRKLAGDIDMNQGGGLRPREVAQGWMLPCCSKPLSDLELDR
ncbi:MAG TPA: 2Fe-2S iron-sulfur cluster-binding protein, partial [Variovorax sp.]|nr:2Fe-2S iron-sulfur cluster-binding protein [Variovorax sp.]